MADGQILRKGDGGVHGTEALPQHLAGASSTAWTTPMRRPTWSSRVREPARFRNSPSPARPSSSSPRPNVAEDHQTKNARALADRGAALLIPDAEAVEKALPAALVLAGDLPRREELERNIRTMLHPTPHSKWPLKSSNSHADHDGHASQKYLFPGNRRHRHERHRPLLPARRGPGGRIRPDGNRPHARSRLRRGRHPLRGRPGPHRRPFP